MSVSTSTEALPGRLLLVDDTAVNRRLLRDQLEYHGFVVAEAPEGTTALNLLQSAPFDLVLLDVMMPAPDGYEVCRRIRATPSLQMLPVVLITALEGREERVRGLEAGADDFLHRDFNSEELLARVRSLLRIKRLYDTVSCQAAQLAAFNSELEQRVADQVARLERYGRLARFFSPQVANLILSGAADDPLATHRREITVVFLDLRGFTSFSETTEPEEVMRTLREFHHAMGQRVAEYEGTLERFTGDGMMIFFNDPETQPDADLRACRMAWAMQQDAVGLCRGWLRRGVELNLSIGIAKGFATLGAIGFEGRTDYAAIGSVTNLASRLCDAAEPGRILVSQRVAAMVDSEFALEDKGRLTLNGFSKPVPVHVLAGLPAGAGNS